MWRFVPRNSTLLNLLCVWINCCFTFSLFHYFGQQDVMLLQEAVLEQLCELLLDYLHTQCHTAAFPELIVPLVIQVGLASWVLYLWLASWSSMLGDVPLGFSGGSNMLGVAPVVIQVGLGYSGGSNVLGIAPLVIQWV